MQAHPPTISQQQLKQCPCSYSPSSLYLSSCPCACSLYCCLTFGGRPRFFGWTFAGDAEGDEEEANGFLDDFLSFATGMLPSEKRFLDSDESSTLLELLDFCESSGKKSCERSVVGSSWELALSTTCSSSSAGNVSFVVVFFFVMRGFVSDSDDGRGGVEVTGAPVGSEDSLTESMDNSKTQQDTAHRG